MKRTYVRDDLRPSFETQPRRWWYGIAIVLGALFTAIVISFILYPRPLLSPINETTTFQFLPCSQTNPGDTIVYGFLPYWNLGKTELQPELTHLGYFGLTIDADGTFVTRNESGGEPGFAKLQSEAFLELVETAERENIALEIVLVQFDNDDIVAFLSDPDAHQQLLSSLDSVLLAYPFSGVNIDIEYSGEMSDALRDNMTAFMTTLDDHLDSKYDDVQLSIDVYASAGENKSLWDVQAIGQEVDLMVVMAYDFHRRSSPKAGPVAPIFGGDSLWDHDINEHLQKFMAQVPAEKLLLGVPFYGYEWQTTSLEPQALTFPNTGVTASYERVQELLDEAEEKTVTEHWSEEALSPFITYVEDEENYIVYFENSRSLSYKLDFVNQLELGGIAIWALGYEGKYRDLWDVIQRKL